MCACRPNARHPIVESLSERLGHDIALLEAGFEARIDQLTTMYNDARDTVETLRAERTALLEEVRHCFSSNPFEGLALVSMYCLCFAGKTHTVIILHNPSKTVGVIGNRTCHVSDETHVT